MYQKTLTDTLIRIADGALIPADERNTDYLEYLVWVSAGNNPEPADTGPEFQQKISTVRATREAILNRLAGIALEASLSGDISTTQAYLVVRKGLLDITKDVPSDPVLVDASITSRYSALVQQCTPAMVSAFAQVDA